MALQISREQSSWLTKFLAQTIPAMTPDMAVNTAGGGAGEVSGAGGPQDAGPGMMDRLDRAVNTLGRTLFGDVGNVPGGKNVPPREVKPEPTPTAVPVPAAAGAAPDAPAVPPPEAAPAAAPEAPGFTDRLDSAVNNLGKTLFGDAGS